MAKKKARKKEAILTEGTVSLALRISRELLARTDVLAKAEVRTRSDILRAALSEGLSVLEQRRLEQQQYAKRLRKHIVESTGGEGGS